MIISKRQIDAFEEFFRMKFISYLQTKHVNESAEKIVMIVNEALHFGFEMESHIAKYVQLYLKNQPLFIKKPEWMIYVLKDEDFILEEKLNYIQKKIS
jgi:hypothetical protein